MNSCTCDQHGNYCPVHPNCACGCPKHAHSEGGCIAGSMRCHGCSEYRVAVLRRLVELDDEQLDDIVVLQDLRDVYKALRAHHIEETTALRSKLKT